MRGRGRGNKEKNEPIVPRPPTLNLPKRLNGAEQVVMLGVIWRITITFDGSWGINFEVILFVNNIEMFSILAPFLLSLSRLDFLLSLGT